MAVKGILQPKIEQPGMVGFLLWARRDSPYLYGALVNQFREVAEFEEAVSADDRPGGMGGIMDVLSTVGSGIASAAGSIGSFISNNASSIFSAAGGFLVAQQQAKVASTQLALARATQPPAQTAYVTLANGQQIPVPVQQTGAGYQAYYNAAQPQSGIMATLSAIPLQTWLIGGAAAVAIYLLLKRR